MNEDEALRTALEALEFIPESGSMLGAHAEEKRLQAITAIQQARALDKKAENARELGLDYAYRPLQDNGSKYFGDSWDTPPAQPAPVQKRPQNCGTGYCSCVECVMQPVGTKLYTTAAQPAPVQEPVAYLCENAVGHKYFRWKKPSSTYKPIALYTTPPAAQPAVPDAIGPNEDELPAYVAGWNDCRAEILRMRKP